MPERQYPMAKKICKLPKMSNRNDVATLEANYQHWFKIKLNLPSIAQHVLDSVSKVAGQNLQLSEYAWHPNSLVAELVKKPHAMEPRDCHFWFKEIFACPLKLSSQFQEPNGRKHCCSEFSCSTTVSNFKSTARKVEGKSTEFIVDHFQTFHKAKEAPGCFKKEKTSPERKTMKVQVKRTLNVAKKERSNKPLILLQIWYVEIAQKLIK